MSTVDRDKVFMLPRETAAVMAHKALDAIQRDKAEAQVAGVAVLFATVANRCGFDPQELHALGMKMLTNQPHHFKGNVQIESLRDYAGLRLKDDVKP